MTHFRSFKMSKETSSDRAPCHYEWTFHKPRALGILPSGSHNLNQSTISKNNNSSTQTSSNQHIPYSGPTLWNPKYHKRSPDKFLTLTPLRPSRKTVDTSLPVISLTPRRGSREFSFFGNDNIKNSSLGVNFDATKDSENLGSAFEFDDDPDDELQKLSTQDIIDKLSFLSVQGKKKKEQVSIFPDVYAIVRSPRRAGKPSKIETLTNYHNESRNKKSHNSSTGNSFSSMTQFNRSKILPSIPRTSFSNCDSPRTASISLPNKNIQDNGTLFSRQQNAFYARITREPTVIQPAPAVGFRYVFPKTENQQTNSEDIMDEDNSLLKPKNKESTVSRYNRNRLKDRRSYIRWNVHHHVKPKKMMGWDTESEINGQNCVEKQEIFTSPVTNEPRKEEKLRAIFEKLHALQRKNDDRNNLETSLSTKRRIAEHFCDVLGQKTCQRCQEFYTKNFQTPAKESVNKIRSSSPLSRENTLTMPTVGLQKVIIRIKDESGRMEIATEEINKELL